ncbi:MAG: translation elongation factor Ts [Flavobacteriales bacterium]|jgi:elongation factor Ts|uniref:translation elongation factor Ts n=1 Tax=Blattabacterium sp. (Mastotermes darwiniensis) TaxID=39768 RepID=UPI000231DE7A|nr:translation elongation factor Ts [Blattabacterium sp. (Mastotermes darwiniensis)]AER40686.1 elongation factor Ts [Blattabacterium sp. (Mastotermes darwiniensis) str. MADAR]MDR1804786.1 translation elongation factor Ts [Flavobacteriales bacterium]
MKISLIKRLRETTGVGIMDCKKALIRTNGNFEMAIDLLRKKGKKIAIRRSYIEGKEGAVTSSINLDSTCGTIIGLSCETDFLSRSSIFLDFLFELSRKSFLYDKKREFLFSFHHGVSIQEMIFEKMSVVGEKLELKIFEKINSPFVTNYTHNNQIATLVGFNSVIDKSVAKDIAMHITAMDPIALNEQEIPEYLMKKELEIIQHQVKIVKKPEEMKKKIISGKIKKFVLENTLLNQKFIKDQRITVQEYIKKFTKGEIKINSYKRICLL